MTKSVKRPKPQGISAKAVRELLQDPQWTINEEISKKFGVANKVYVHSDGRGIVVFSSGRASFYATAEDFSTMVQLIEQRRGQSPRHILKDLLLYGQDFINHVPNLVNELAIKLKIPREELDGSVLSLGKVEQKVKRLGREKSLEPIVFTALVAYIGEVMKQAVGGQGEMWLSKDDGETWEPWIVDPEKRACNAWSALYDMLTEPEPISIMGSTGVLINTRRRRVKETLQSNTLATLIVPDNFIPTDPPDSESEEQ